MDTFKHKKIAVKFKQKKMWENLKAKMTIKFYKIAVKSK